MANWSEFASAYAAQVNSLCASVTALYLPFFVFGRVLTRLGLVKLAAKGGPSGNFYSHPIGHITSQSRFIDHSSSGYVACGVPGSKVA